MFHGWLPPLPPFPPFLLHLLGHFSGFWMH